MFLWQIVIFVFILGAVIGSFLNVCIFRIPEKKSLVSPASSCPKCFKKLHWYHNIPIASYVVLGGKCCFCQSRISMRYPLVEMLTGVVYVLLLLRLGIHWWLLVYWAFASALIVVAFIDLDHQIIPDVISLPGILAGVLCSFFIPWISWVDSVLGVLIGGGSLLLIGAGYELLAKREGMGGGDVKLVAMIGAFLGWKAIFPVVFFSALIGLCVSIPLLLKSKADMKLAVPFGPFLVLATFIYMFCGREIITWYLMGVNGLN